MIVPINNNFSPLPFYDVSDAGVSDELKNKYLNSEKPYAYGEVFDLPIAGGWLMPFQFIVNYDIDRVVSCYVIPIDNAALTEQVSGVVGLNDSINRKSNVLFAGEHHGNLPIGRCYIEVDILDGNGLHHTYMSDIFNNVCASSGSSPVIPDGYVKLKYTNDHYLRYNGGKIYFYDQKIEFEVLIDTTVGKPSYSYEEKSSERLGYKYIESQVSKKSYMFTFVAPEYLCDALRLLPMCNSRVISDKWHTYNNISDVNLDVEWLEQGNLARVTITFDNDTVVANLAEYISVAPSRLNTDIPIPPEPQTTLPIVAINSIQSVSQNNATVEAEVVSDGGRNLLTVGICWSDTTSTPVITDNFVSSPAVLGRFVSVLAGLQAGTRYYVRAVAINNNGGSFSDTIVIDTPQLDSLPTVLTFEAANITELSADLSGSVTDEGTMPVVSRGIVLSGTNQIPSVDDSDATAYVDGGSGVGSFVVPIYGLDNATRYWYRAFAVSRVGTSYGEVKTFVTRETPI